jgi:hypothetical protein
MYKCRRQFLGSCNTNSAPPLHIQYSVGGDAKFSDSIRMAGARIWKAVAVMISAATIHCVVKWPYACSSGMDMCLKVTW